MKRTVLSSLILLFAAAACPFAKGQSADGFSADGTMRVGSLTDSAAVQNESSLARTLEKFRVLKFKKLDGAPLDSVSPMAYDCYLTALEAYGQQKPDTREWLQVREVLRDVSHDLLEGAYFYSGARNQAEMTKFARAYLDISLLDSFKDEGIDLDPKTLAMLAYISASGAYNEQNYGKAVDYFKIYLSTEGDSNLEQVYVFMMQSCLQDKQWDLGIATAEKALALFPQQKHILMVAMQMCIDGGRGENLQKFLTMALNENPNDEKLLDIQGKLYEDAGDYQQALDVYNNLNTLHPNSLSTTKHIGLCYYNLAVEFFNQAINEPEGKAAARLRRKAKNYFASAAHVLRDVIVSAPTAVPYLRSLGVCYLCMEDKYNFEKINERLKLLGEDVIGDMFMPPNMTYNNGDPNFATTNSVALKDAPTYSKYGRDYITSRLGQWSAKGEFEKLEDYNKRVNQVSIRQKYDELKQEASEKYLEEYSKRLRINDLHLQPYDATNEVFMITSSFGPILVKVPLKNGEAESFKENWGSVRFQQPKFFIDEDSVRISEITFIAANGKKYDFKNSRSLDYSVPDINIDFASILGSGDNSNTTRTTGGGGGTITIAGTSDIDGENVPVTGKTADKTLALIIANENYKNVAKVPHAFADGATFADYCRKTIGVPEANVQFCSNATLGEMLDAISELQRRANLLGSDAEIMVYYAGHGLPDEKTKDAYLLASDANPTNPRTWFKLSEFYTALSELKSNSVMVFLDACFSGAERSTRPDATIMASAGARGAVIRANDAVPTGNMFVLSAASGNETALPYDDKQHGLFTYFLLKKMQETKGNISLKELSEWVKSQVLHYSTFTLKKPQTPSTFVSGRMTDQWKSKKLVK